MFNDFQSSVLLKLWFDKNIIIFEL